MKQIVQMKITLSDSKPAIWRRFLVGDNVTFHELHNIIQEIMGWSNYHLYEFTADDVSILEPNEDYDHDFKNSKKVKLRSAVKKEGQKFGYLYDFGDGWEHTIVIEKLLPIDKTNYIPTCIDGKMACPPEDCGGIYGYRNFIKIIQNKKHPEHKEMLAWVGGMFNPEELDMKDINRRLQKANRR